VPKEKLAEESVDIEKLKPEHTEFISYFSCGSPDEDLFLKKDALQNQNFRLSETFLLFEKGKRKIISYVTLSLGEFKLSSDKNFFDVRIRKKPFRIYEKHLPCLRIGKLATDENEAGRGGATLLVTFSIKKATEINSIFPLPFLALDAYREKARFYEKQGFAVAFSPRKNDEVVPMYMHLK